MDKIIYFWWYCTVKVVLQIWGDGFRTGYEGWDDAGTISDDGWDSTCAVEIGWKCTGGTIASKDVWV